MQTRTEDESCRCLHRSVSEGETLLDNENTELCISQMVVPLGVAPKSDKPLLWVTNAHVTTANAFPTTAEWATITRSSILPSSPVIFPPERLFRIAFPYGQRQKLESPSTPFGRFEARLLLRFRFLPSE
jgi:hypothetical protein